MDRNAKDYQNKKQTALYMLTQGFYTKEDLQNETGLTKTQIQSIIFNSQLIATTETKYLMKGRYRIAAYHISSFIEKKIEKVVSIDELPKEINKNKLIDWYLDTNKGNTMNVKELYKLAKMHGINVYTCLNGKKKFLS